MADLSRQYIVDEKGNPTAVILPIEEYKKFLSVIEKAEDHRESEILSQSAEFTKLVQMGLDDISTGRVSPWKEIWDEL